MVAFQEVHRPAFLAVVFVGLVIACGKPQPPPSAPVTPAPPAEPASPPPSTPPETTTKEPAPDAQAGAALNVDPQAALATAKKENKPTFIVFCAAWATACRELALVLADSSVKKVLDERFVVARVDATDDEDATTKEWLKQFKVKGLPAMLVFNRKGKEVARAESYISAPEVIKLLEKAK